MYYIRKESGEYLTGIVGYTPLWGASRETACRYTASRAAVIMERLRLTDCTLEKEIKRKGCAAAVMKYREKGGEKQ